MMFNLNSMLTYVVTPSCYDCTGAADKDDLGKNKGNNSHPTRNRQYALHGLKVEGKVERVLYVKGQDWVPLVFIISYILCS